ncbi:MAG: hypothetical protein EBX59_12735, partial [Betaproteobacteria bacterium]|nr:hypothetical protein [Betaproteobacteria bacterium]
MLAVLDAVRDESGKDAPVRLVIEPRSSRVELSELINLLLVNTSLETNLSLNMVMVGLDGRPVQKSLLDCLSEWCSFRLDTVRRRSGHRLDKVRDRIHVLEGRQLVLLNVDEVIRIIRESEEPKPALIEAFSLSDRQAEDILEIRLRQLARLTSYAGLLLDEVDMGTVDFIDNYDVSTREPATLPARLPMVLLNGASGIAVGMATEIPSHNLKEVAAAAALLIRKPKSSIEDLLELLPGPDLPGGAQIISTRTEILEAYRSGRGSLRMRARYEIEELARGQWQLVVNELPHGVSTQQILEQIEELTNPKPRLGKKSVSNEQLQIKQAMLAVLDAVRD